MPDQLPELEDVKALPLSSGVLSFYVVKRRLVQRRARYDILLVNIDGAVQDKLRSIFVNRLNAAAGTMQYDFHTADQDDNLLTLPTAATDFQHIIEIVTGEAAPPLAQTQDQLLDVWFYVARFDIPGKQPLWAVRKAPKGWATKKKHGIANLIFSGDMQLEIEPHDIFKIDDYYDFFSFEGRLFIFYKSAFETDLNFREGIMQDRSDLVAEWGQSGVFKATEDINGMIGNNMRLLRKAAQVKNLGYFRDQEFLDKLSTANEERSLGLEYDETGALIVNAERIGFILHIFTNGRVESIINQEVFDVDA